MSSSDTVTVAPSRADELRQQVERLMVHDVFQPVGGLQAVMAADERGLWVFLMHHMSGKLWYLHRAA